MVSLMVIFMQTQKPYTGRVIIQLVLVMPAKNATSERSFSALRRVKTYLRTKMSQKRLNHLLILNVHKERTDTLDLKDTLNSFVKGSQHRAGCFLCFNL